MDTPMIIAQYFYELRQRLNGVPYPDNPDGLPYDNKGNLIEKGNKDET